MRLAGRRLAFVPFALLTAPLVCSVCPALADAPLTLDQALAEARAANARLPVAASEAAIAAAQAAEARGRLGPSLSIQGTLRWAPHGPYCDAACEEALQIAAQQPLYAGGALRAGLASASASARAAAARYRIAEKDLALDVASAYFDLARLDDEIAYGRDGLGRLRAYRDTVRDRLLAGQGVAADLARTDVELASRESDLVDLTRQRDQARLTLDDLLGRPPESPIDLAPLPPLSSPTVPASIPTGDWSATPEIGEARANLHASQADIAVARARRRPTLDLTADAGVLTGAGSGTSGLGTFAGFNAWADRGFSLGLVLSWPIWDLGVYRAQLVQALRARDRAAAALTVAARAAHLSLASAGVDVGAYDHEVALRTHLLQAAHDAYLEEESLYRGGAATSLEVIDAFGAWMDAARSLVEAVASARTAEARAIRWGTP